MKTAVNFVLKAFPAHPGSVSLSFHPAGEKNFSREATDDTLNCAYLLPSGPDHVALLRESQGDSRTNL
ncbi:MAG: hypothetical protein KIB40_10615 [Pantoea sp.]|uniref:Uncharacterized protein n=1 Tax=Pantoea brenneri TaxID=472694 RepID=A0ABU9MHW8_9GAMM|nr:MULTISPECIES: hypothetical protein [Pantoea]MBS6033584.1 hypothetical protein [Pantoea sp.]MDH1086887.1 hypothetical protein [Pantoea brenneri]MDH2123935.1 hypothetical protein [Pantoea brenneri]